MSGTTQDAMPLARHVVHAGYASIALGLFGGLWMVAALNSEGWVWLVACVLLPASLLVVRGVGLVLTGQALIAEDTPRGPRRLRWIFLLEVGAFALAANLLAASGGNAWLVAVVAFLTAAFLIPVARVLEDRLYMITAGTQIVLCAVVSLIMRGRIELADPIFGLVMGLSLWLTAVALLLRGHRIAGLLKTPGPSAAAS
ncbi:MAG TPA: hypothetical protein VIE13_13615 [Terriglobales bacterium]|jgi:hypothetical protein